jgi:hypothetical protein
MAGVKNTASQPHLAYIFSPRWTIFSRPARLVPAGTFKQPTAPAAADGVAAEPARLTRDGGHHDHRRQVQPPWLAATAAAPRAAVPMAGTPAHEAATARRRCTSARWRVYPSG